MKIITLTLLFATTAMAGDRWEQFREEQQLDRIEEQLEDIQESQVWADRRARSAQLDAESAIRRAEYQRRHEN